MPPCSQEDVNSFTATSAEISRLEDAINEQIRNGRTVKASNHDRSELSVDSSAAIDHLRGVPKGQAVTLETLRLVHIDGLDANPCGGTHLKSLGMYLFHLILLAALSLLLFIIHFIHFFQQLKYNC